MWSVIKVFKQSALNEPKNKTLTQRAAQKQPTKRTTTGTPVTNFWCFDRGHKMPFRDCFATSLLSKRLRSSWSFLPWGWRRRNESSFFCGGSQRDKYGQLFSDQAVFRCGEVWALVPFCKIHRTIHWFAGVFVCHIGVLRASLQVCSQRRLQLIDRGNVGKSCTFTQKIQMKSTPRLRLFYSSIRWGTGDIWCRYNSIYDCCRPRKYCIGWT